MTPLLLLASALAAIVASEIGMRAVGSAWLRSGLRDVNHRLRAFRAARTDDERQRLILHAGITTLRFSLSILGLIALLFLIVGIVPWVSDASGSQQTAFYVAVSLCAVAWSAVRSRLAGPDPQSPRVPHELH